MSRPSRSRYPTFPLLLAAYPALFVASYNTAETRATDLVVAVTIMLLIGVSVYGLVLLGLRDRRRPSNAALIASLGILWVLCLPTLCGEFRQLLGPFVVVRWRYLLVASTTAVAFLMWALARSTTDRIGAARIVATVVYLLLASSVFRIAAETRRQRGLVARAAGVDALFGPIRVAPTGDQASARAAPVRDVYLIILDEYANSRVLLERFAFSNAAFEDSLRGLGFTIPARVRSNYNTTNHSVASLLNLAYLDGLESALGSDEPNAYVLVELIRHNRAFRFLRERGYATYVVPSPDFLATREIGVADATAEPTMTALRRIYRERYFVLSATLQATVPAFLVRATGYSFASAAATVVSLEALRASVAIPVRPKFVFAHLMLTHAPFHVGARCEPRKWLSRGERRFRAGYLAGLQCTNRVLLEVVTEILKQSPTPPIIILQGDHGTGTLLTQQPRFTTASITPQQAAERLGAFGAYYLPSGGGEHLGDDVTPVGLMRFVWSYYLGADLGRAPNRSYLAAAQRPFRFALVPESAFHPPTRRP